MAAKVRDLIEQVRSVLQGTLADELTVLDDDYSPGDTSVTLRYPKRNLQAGSLLCAGLATWYVLSVSVDGRMLQVIPSADGGPDSAVLAGEIIRVKPRFSTWSIFREWNNELTGLSAPKNGVYAFGAFTTPTDWINGTYPLPASWAPQEPVRLLIARYRRLGTDSWQRIAAEWQPDGNTVRIYGRQAPATTLEFVFAFPYLEATSLDQDPKALGLNEFTEDIPGLGVCATLGRTAESRRVQLASQGDPRRAQEVAAGANLGVSRDWRAEQQSRIVEESGRLQAQFGYWKGVNNASARLGSFGHML